MYLGEMYGMFDILEYAGVVEHDIVGMVREQCQRQIAYVQCKSSGTGRCLQDILKTIIKQR